MSAERDELAEVLFEQDPFQTKGDARDVADAILAAGYAKPAPREIEWGVASKWGSHTYGTRENALRQIERHEASGEDARLISRHAAVMPGVWKATK